MAMDLDMQVDENTSMMNGPSSQPRRSNLKGKGKVQHEQEHEERTATLHRIRFLDYMPSSILAVALTPSSYDPITHYPYVPTINSAQGREILALGRQNGEIEIYTWIGGEGNSLLNKQARKASNKRGYTLSTGSSTNKQGWVLERRLAPPSPSRVEHLLFTHQTILSEEDYNLCEDEREIRKELDKLRKTKPRLFTSGGGSDLWEWEWSNSKDGGMGYVKKTLGSQGGAIWSISPNASHTTLALGCDDGAVRLVNLWDGALELTRKFDSTKTRLLSVAWGPQTIRGSNNGKGKQKQQQQIEQASSATATAATTQLIQYEDSYIITGCADSTVRKWDFKTGRSTSRMTTDKIKGEHTLVWSVAVIAASAFIGSKAATTFDGDVLVSGDSMGLVKFWDEKTNTQIDSLQCHKTDILCLAIGPDGKSVYSSGVDQTVSEVQFASVRQGFARSGKQDVGRWIHTHSRRLHAHDVRALTISPSYSAVFPGPGNKTTSTSLAMSKVPVVISGGLDFSLVFTPAATSSTPATLLNPISDTKSLTFAASTQRKASYIPQRTSSLVSLAREVGIMAERTLQGLNLWSLKPIQAASSSSPPAISATAAAGGEQQPYQKLLEIELNTQTNLIASAISEDGQWLAASDLYETRLWRLKTASDGSIRARRCATLTATLAAQTALKSYEHQAASHLHFTKDSSKLIMATVPGSHVVVLQLPESKHDDVTVLRVFGQHRSHASSGRALAGRNAPPNGKHTGEAGDSEDDDSESEDEDDSSSESVPNLACMTTSTDGQWLLTADMTGRLHVFNLDSLQYHAALPSVELPPVDIAFSPSNASIAVVALPNNTIQIFDVDQRNIPNWAQAISANVLRSFGALREPILGARFDPTTPQSRKRNSDTLVLYGANFIGTIKISASSSSSSSAVAGVAPKLSNGTHEKRKRDEDDTTMTPAKDSNNNNHDKSIGEDIISSDDDSDADLPITSSSSNNNNSKARPISITYKYQPILFLDFTASGDMVVVEKPYFSMLGQLAPAFAKKKYGST